MKSSAKKSASQDNNGASISGRQKAFESALENINKKFGSGSVLKFSDKPKYNGLLIPSGSLALDIALGIGGYAPGRIIEIYGPESGGKTTLALTAVAQAQRSVKERRLAWEAMTDKERAQMEEPPVKANCLYVDVEHALDTDRAEQIGVDISEVYISQPDSAEDALQIIEEAVMSGAVDIVVLDSVAAMAPRAELEGNIGDSQVALQARLMGQALRKLTSSVSKFNTVVIFINQIRELMNAMSFGPKTTTPGGRALKFYASMRINVSKIQTVKETHNGNSVDVGIRVKADVVKNKLAAPMRKAEFDIMFFEGGISRAGEILEIGTEIGLISKRGAFFRLTEGDVMMGQGAVASRKFLYENPDIFKSLESRIREHYFSDIHVSPVSDDSAASGSDDYEEFDSGSDNEE